MKVYIAGPYAAREQLQVVADQIAATGKHTVNSSWLYGAKPIGPGTLGASLDETDDVVHSAVVQDLKEVQEAAVIVQFTAAAVVALDPTLLSSLGFSTQQLNTGGRHVEFGYALGKGTSLLIVVGAPENIFQRAMAVVVPDLDALMQLLEGWS